MLKGEEKVADREFLMTLEGWIGYYGLTNGTKRAIRECIEKVDRELYSRKIDPEEVIGDLTEFEPLKNDKGHIIPCRCF